MPDQPARPGSLVKIFSLLLVTGLIGSGIYLVIKRSPGEKPVPEINQLKSGGPEAGDIPGVTTFKPYEYNPVDRLPAVEGDSNYRWDDGEKILRFSYNVWPGWLPVIAANRGARANRDSVFYSKYGFQVEMVLMDDPIAARDAFADGEIHTLWGTVDMMVLLAPQLIKDGRSAPRIVQQIDWSSGGHGIVVRRPIRSIVDLKHRSIVAARNSAGEYYLMSLLLSAGLRPSDVTLEYTATAFEATAAFLVNGKLDACVSWAPDIYRIPGRVRGARILSNTRDASRLIADVYAVRADFVRDHPDIVKGLVAGIFEGMQMVEQHTELVAKWMADAFGMRPDEVLAVRNDARPTGLRENVEFFLNAAHPTNFEQTWKNASNIYRELGRIRTPVSFDQVVDFRFLQELRQEGN